MHGRYGLAGDAGELGESTVVIQSEHSREALGRERRSRFHSDVGIGVAGVAHNEHLDVAAGNSVKCFALFGEDGTVGREQFGAFHAFGARTGTHKNGGIGILECDHRVGRGSHVCQKREGAISQFHHHALESSSAFRRIAFEQLQNDRLIGAEHVTSGNAEKQSIANIASRTGHGNANRFLHGIHLLDAN